MFSNSQYTCHARVTIKCSVNCRRTPSGYVLCNTDSIVPLRPIHNTRSIACILTVLYTVYDCEQEQNQTSSLAWEDMYMTLGYEYLWVFGSLWTAGLREELLLGGYSTGSSSQEIVVAVLWIHEGDSVLSRGHWVETFTCLLGVSWDGSETVDSQTMVACQRYLIRARVYTENVSKLCVFFGNITARNKAWCIKSPIPWSYTECYSAWVGA